MRAFAQTTAGLRGRLPGTHEPCGSNNPDDNGRPNRIVAVDGDNVVVATQRSPEGEPVALMAVQAAADRVFDGEIVRIDPASVDSAARLLGRWGAA